MRFTGEIIHKLKYYVYMYINPRTAKPFYIGKGYGNRVFEHIKDKSESQKVKQIKKILKAGYVPRIEILRYGLEEQEASLVEAAAIDLIGRKNLTNLQRGAHSNSFGRVLTDDLIIMLKAKPVTIKDKTILITINKLYRSGMSKRELYEATRGVWVVGNKREKIEIALAVYQGVVREVYRIKKWYPAGTLEYRTRDSKEFDKTRWEFEGEIAEDLRSYYVNKSVRSYLKKNSQNPIRYII